MSIAICLYFPYSLFSSILSSPNNSFFFCPFCLEKSEGFALMNPTPPSQQIAHSAAPQIGTNSWPNDTILSVTLQNLIFDIAN